MRQCWMMVLLVLAVAVEALAGFELPKRVFSMDQLEKVKELAQKKRVPITFVYTDKDTT